MKNVTGRGSDNLNLLVWYLIFYKNIYIDVTKTCQNKCFNSVTKHFNTYILHLFPISEVSGLSSSDVL
jgi:hypothetical protein